VQYRGAVLPLVHLGSRAGSVDPLNVIVYSENGRSVGLVVDAIVDIADDVLLSGDEQEEQGQAGSVVVRGRVTELLDVRQAVLRGDPHFYGAVLPSQSRAFA
jgi:two-component system chemotaxis sensor kinase CheA